MRLETKLERLENELNGNTTNPLIAGTHTHHVHVIIGKETQTVEYVEDNTTGARYTINETWRRWINEYDKVRPFQTIHVMIGDDVTKTPDRFEVLTTDGVTTHTTNENER
jgi:hypothetical protein